MKLPDALFSLCLKFLGRGGKVRVLVAEELVGNFTGQQHPQIRMLMNVVAHQIHADGGPDGGDVIGAKQGHHLGQGFQHIFLCNNDLPVVGTDKVRYLPGVFEVNGV